ncbi:SpoIIE family protein phosphatase [candidate division KSB1 bacterium]|nr:SpoIIE family protein phosphatase [candidate division KSB1 bacterium]
MSPRKRTDFLSINDIDRLKEENRKLHALIEATQAINSTLDLDRLLGIILESARKNIGAERGTLYLVDQDKKEIWSKILQGEEKIEVRLPFGEGIAGAVAQTGKTVNIKDAYLDARFNRRVDEETGYRTKTVLCSPIRNKDGLIVGVFQILNKESGIFSPSDEEFLDALSVHAALALENAQLYQEALEKKRIEDEITLAREIQQRLLPGSVPRVDSYQISGVNRSSRQIGGDYYDLIQLDEGKLGFAIGDVSGKGIPAALLMAAVQASLHSQIRTGCPIEEVVSRINDLIYQSTDPSKFITFFYGILHPQTGEVEYVNAGHNPPLLVRQTGEPEFLEKGGVILGVAPGLPYYKGTLSLSEGDLLVLFTDGVTEAKDPEDREFSEERFYELIGKCRDSSTEEIVSRTLSEIDAFTSGMPQSDDITLVVIKKIGNSSSSRKERRVL